MRMLTSILASLVLATAVSPALAAGPVGAWSCMTSDLNTVLIPGTDEHMAPLATLILNDASYSYSAAQAEPSGSGHLQIDGDVVTFSDGPLLKMGVAAAVYALADHQSPYFSAESSEARAELVLTRAHGAGGSIVCYPDPEAAL